MTPGASDYTISQETIAKTIELLRVAGHTVNDMWAGPTVFSVEDVYTPDTDGEHTGKIMVACEHNRGGWEAVLEIDGEEGNQIPLIDGPDEDARPLEIAAWVDRLANLPLRSMA